MHFLTSRICTRLFLLAHPILNPGKSNRMNPTGGRAFFDFLLSQETLKRIKTFGLEKYGEPLFGLIPQ